MILNLELDIWFAFDLLLETNPLYFILYAPSYPHGVRMWSCIKTNKFTFCDGEEHTPVHFLDDGITR